MTDPASVTSPAPLPLLTRIIGVITSPKATFHNIVAAPRPVGVLFVVSLVIALASVAPQFTEKGRQAMLDTQIKATETLSARFGQPATPEVYAALEARSRSVGWRLFGAVNPFIGLPIWCLLVTAVYWATFNVALGGTASFKQVLAIETHQQVIGALGAVVGVPIMAMSGKISMFGPFTLGALAPGLEDGSKLAAWLGSISIFGIWGAFVTGIGLGVLYKRNGTTIGIVLTIVYLLVMYVVMSLFGSFMGMS